MDESVGGMPKVGCAGSPRGQESLILYRGDSRRWSSNRRFSVVSNELHVIAPIDAPKGWAPWPCLSSGGFREKGQTAIGPCDLCAMALPGLFRFLPA